MVVLLYMYLNLKQLKEFHDIHWYIDDMTFKKTN